MDQGELRYNPATGRWVILAPARRRRPRDFAPPGRSGEGRVALDPGCPFCPGNEDRLAGLVWETRPGPDGSPWQCRVVANKYPALLPQASPDRRGDGFFQAAGGLGRHEVIIESPRHDIHPALMGEAEAERLVAAYRRRYAELLREPWTRMVILFRNHGPRAGTSLAHPHSQIVASSVASTGVRERQALARDHFHRSGGCLYCEMLDREAAAGTRMVLENPGFAAFVPYAAEVPCEAWILPRRHAPGFEQAGEGELREFSLILRGVLRRLYELLGDPDYNYVLASAAEGGASEPHFHWHLRIRPRIQIPGGFEIGTGMRINASLPERDAAFLRG